MSTYCDLCDRDFRLPSHLIQHKVASRRHDYCRMHDRELPSASALIQHYKNHHEVRD
jgi:hypothetical protein